jgi:hypothetical protein
MRVRQLIAAFLSILLLAGGPAVGAVPEPNGHSSVAMTQITDCGDLGHETSGSAGEAAGACNEPQQSHCLLSAPHCSFTFVYGVVGGFPATLPKVRDLFAPSAVRTAYQSPIPEVLTPPPNLLS